MNLVVPLNDLASVPPYFEDSVMFAGGRLSLDFVNTFCMRRGVPLEFIPTPEALHHWLRIAAMATHQDFGALKGPFTSEQLARAVELREAIRALILGVIQREEPSPQALKVLNQALRDNPAYPQLATDLSLAMSARNESEKWLSDIANDAAELLTKGDLTLVRQCEADTCIRVFYDTTKNHKRRWCVEKCGNRVKSAAYYGRKRALGRGL